MVGGGVIGLSVACELAGAGHEVTVTAHRPATGAVSAVAGALWLPSLIDETARTRSEMALALRRFCELADDPATGVDLRWGRIAPGGDLTWVRSVAPETSGADRFRLPVLDMPVYLGWLTARARDLGVSLRTGRVDTLAGVAGDAIVVAAGLGSGALLGDDDTMVPVRGQVVRLRNPGLTDWVVDDANPAGITYVFPRRGDIVCGGTSLPGVSDTAEDPVAEKLILERATALVPGLAGLEIVSRAVGLRPWRPAGVRVEPVAGHGRPVVACYGHGGAGVTASWGSAATVRRLLS